MGRNKRGGKKRPGRPQGPYHDHHHNRNHNGERTEPSASLPSFGGGFVDPSVLARHAALARGRSENAESPSSSSDRRASKRPNVRRDDDDEHETPHRRGRKQRRETGTSHPTTTTTTTAGDDQDVVRLFGRPKWTRTEQLCHLLIVSPPFAETTTTVTVVFVARSDEAKDLAAIFKPVVRPLPSFAYHRGVKHSQRVQMVERLLRRRDDDDDDDVQTSAVVFCHDDALSSLAETFARTSRSETKRDTSTTTTTIVFAFVHHDPPETSAARDARARLAAALSRDGTRSIALDGTSSSSRSGPAPPWPRSVATFPSPPPNADRDLARAVANAAVRARRSEDGSPRERAARERLEARLLVVRAETRRRRRRRLLRSTSEGGAEEKEEEKKRSPRPTDGAKLVRRKMAVLGMSSSHAVGSATASTPREAAMTRWLDGTDGPSVGASWTGSVRFGASVDDACRRLASHYRSARRDGKDSSCPKQCLCGTVAIPSPSSSTCRKVPADSSSSFTSSRCWYRRALSRWRPNPDNGGGGGLSSDGPNDFSDLPPAAKACGHNETAMFVARPFAALEVLNSRVCSAASPAPGNSRDHEGCLEFLRRVCAESRADLTVWDRESFTWLDGGEESGDDDDDGKCAVRVLRKEALLELSLPRLEWLVPTMRRWTLVRERRRRRGEEGVGGARRVGCHPRNLLEGVDLALRVAAAAASASDGEAAVPVAGGNANADVERFFTSRFGDDRDRDVGDDNGGSSPNRAVWPTPKIWCRIFRYALPGSPEEWKSLRTVSIGS